MAAYDLDDPGVLLCPAVVADPMPFYDLLRERAPVWRVPGQDTFLVVGPGLLREVVGRPADFSSNLVSLVHRGDDGGLALFDMLPLGDPSNVLATADPPDHGRHRRLLQPHLSPAAVAKREPLLRATARRMLAPLLAAGGGDVVATLCDPFPATVICQLVGLPEADIEVIVPLVAATAAVLDGVTEADGMGAAAAAALELMEYSSARLHAAIDVVGMPAGVLFGVLGDAIGDGLISFDEALGILLQLLNAGTETTTSLIARAIETLALEPATQSALREEPAGIAAFLEDVLRTNGPFQFHYRYTPADTALGEVAIPANSRVLLMWAAADRRDPGTTSTAGGDADAPPHFAFGRGAHFCIGAHLARLEARIALEELLASTRVVELDRDRPATQRPTIFLRRHTTLPILVR